MIKLFRARLVSYFRSPLLYIAFAITLAIGIRSGYLSNYRYSESFSNNIGILPDPLLLLPMIAVVVTAIVLCAGKPLSDGTIRNMIISGNTKHQVFFSEVLAASITTLIMYILYIFPTVVCCRYFFDIVPISIAVKWISAMLLIFEFVAVLAVAVSYLVAKRAFDLVILFALLISIYMLTGYTYRYYENLDKTDEPIPIPEYIDDIGEQVIVMKPHPYYSTGIKRGFIIISRAVDPMFSLSETRDYKYVKDETQLVDNEENNAEREQELDYNIAKMLIECIALCGIGAFLFGRKELK